MIYFSFTLYFSNRVTDPAEDKVFLLPVLKADFEMEKPFFCYCGQMIK